MENKKNLIFNISGYTFMELIVTMSIVAMVSTVVMVNFHAYSFRGEVDLLAQKFASDLRLVQGYAFGLKEFEYDSDPNTSDRPAGGWGIYFDTSAGSNQEYIVFADYQDGVTDGVADHRYNIGEEFEVINTENVEISSSTVNGIHADKMSIVVQPPKPEIWFCDYVNSCSATTSAWIEFENEGNTKVLELNSFGLIDISR